MKLESLVIADQQRRGEYVPEPCTHRPSSHPSRMHPKTLYLTRVTWRKMLKECFVRRTKS